MIGVGGTTAVHICFGYAQMVKEKPTGIFSVGAGFSSWPQAVRSTAKSTRRCRRMRSCLAHEPAPPVAEQVVEVQRLDRVVRLDPVPGRQLAEPRRGVGFLGGVPPVTVSRRDDRVDARSRDDAGSHHPV